MIRAMGFTAKLPVKDAICRLYRDNEMTVWLQYDGAEFFAAFLRLPGINHFPRRPQ